MDAEQGQRVGVGSGALQVVAGDLVFRWLTELENHGRRPLTIAQYRYNIHGFLRWIESYQIQLQAVTREDIEQWITNERVKVSVGTLQGKMGTVREFYRWMTAAEYITKDPTSHIKLARAPRKLQAVMNLKEVERMARATRTARERAIVEVLYSTGMRRAGLCSIKLHDLDLIDGTVKIEKKGGGEMICLLNESAKKALRRWLRIRDTYPILKRRPTDRLFISRKGPLMPNTVSLLIRRIARRAGMNKRITTHSYRRSMATHLIDADVRLEEIAEILGHEDINTTRTYAQLSTAKIRRAWNKLPRS